MLLHRLAQTHQAVGATRSRKKKAATLAQLLAEGRGLRRVLVPWMSGVLPQGKIGVGYAALRDVRDTPAAAEPSLTVTGVHEALSALQAISGKGSKARRHEALTALFAAATPPEQRLLAELLSGELRQGALAGVMVEAVAEATQTPVDKVRRAAMLSGDLAAAALAAFDGEQALDAFRLQPLRPVQPMLAQTAADPAEAIEQLGEAWFDLKLDGARVQVHRDGPTVKVVSRQLLDVTASVPEVVAIARALPVQRVVLDGEVLSMLDDGRPAPFQQTMRRFGRKLDVERMAAEQPLHTFFFDVLLVDDRELIDEPLAERRRVLEGLVPPQTMVPGLRTDDPQVATDWLRKALEDGHEGLMAKAPSSTYEAGARGASWRKIKPAHTLDLLVLAAEWGSGRRRGYLSNLHLGCRGPEGPVMLGKTFKGLTDELLAWQTEALLARETHREGHVVHVRPELVVEIAFQDVQASPRYPAGLALRLARVKAYRTDKGPGDADDLELVRAIHEGRAPVELRLG
jgi:DNA ligase-1